MLSGMVTSVPAIASLGSALASSVGGIALSGVMPPTVPYLEAPPAYSLHEAQVAQYSRNVYAVLVNGLVVQLAGASASPGGAIAEENLLGPFEAPLPPAGSAAGVPYAPGADHNDYAVAAAAALRALAGNGRIFS
jgi:hypothetical protein